MSPFLICLFGLHAFDSAPSVSARRPTLAVLSFKGLAVSSREAEKLSDTLSNKLAQTKTFQVIERSRLKVSAGPGQGRLDQCNLETCALSVGNQTEIDVIVVGTVEEDTIGLRLSVRMFDVGAKRMLLQSTARSGGNDPAGLFTQLDSMAKDLARDPWRPRPDSPIERASKLEKLKNLKQAREFSRDAVVISSSLALATLGIALAVESYHVYDCSIFSGRDLFDSDPKCREASPPAQALLAGGVGLALFGLYQTVKFHRLGADIGTIQTEIDSHVSLIPLVAPRAGRFGIVARAEL
ncbi:MAG: hypothetical protein IPK50_19750 [Fibrobacterota bacterium]|nr:hypothetical protein [Fibrobacterota bacterium]QQS04498.1 MAG: hypothetical protein IPK50_19750 [Fibrobacterota bacterium]